MMDKLWKLFDQAMERVIVIIGQINTTNLRLNVTIFLWFFTGMNVCISFWIRGDWNSPPLDWIGALGIMLGLDTIQYLGKRKTHMKFADDKKEETNA